jgi:hypothetical protein
MGDGRNEHESGANRERWRVLTRPGVIGSFLLHSALLGFLLYEIAPPVLLAIIPVEFVQLADETVSSPPQPEGQASSQTRPAPRVASVAPPRAAAPRVRPQPAPARPQEFPSAQQPAPDTLPPAPADPLQSQLEALAKLRTQSKGTASPRGNSPEGAQTGYRVEDLIRAQVQRRWNLKLDELGERELTVIIHMVLERDGTVVVAEIVDGGRGKNDNVYRSIALSARNAVLLSSPLTLPAGITDDMRDLTVSFNTRDTQR